ncbi:MAG: hypothetical protein MUF45_12975 [Spirosomaceae bacterium]|nr:hypothetical protein [Spirosomataceae bacterium]
MRTKPFKIRTLVFALIVWLFQCSASLAQSDSVYTQEYLTRSTKFAWTTLGIDMLKLGNGKSLFTENGISKEVAFSSTFIPRLTIGGVHFWGHADFYVSFPLSFLAIQQNPLALEALDYRQGIETGAKIYPWALKEKRLSPYVGISFRLLSYTQEQKATKYTYKAPEFEKMIYPLQVGLTYTTSKSLFHCGIQYQMLSNIQYYSSPTTQAGVQFSNFNFQFGITKYWDTDKHMRTPKSVANENNKYQVLKNENRLDSWYWGLGPSAGLQISKSPYFKKYHPQLYDDFIGGFMPDITFGRFFNKPDMNLGVSYRTMGNTLAGYEDKVSLRRHSFMLEAYKNLFNYLGFVPFCGITGSIENLNANINGNRISDAKPALGFIFGWDIRVTKTGTSLLRTNLRWIPNLNLSVQNEKIMFNQLEFNFIQWVQFIGRKKVYSKYTK